MFIGRPPNQQPRVEPPGAFDGVLEWAMGSGELVRPRATHGFRVRCRFHCIHHCMGFLAAPAAPWVCVPFTPCYEYAREHFPGVQFFLGQGAAPHLLAVICKVGADVVGIIMPIDYEPDTETAAMRELRKRWSSRENRGRP
jgi:hypothetical protein